MAPPSNDDFVNATILTGSSGTFSMPNTSEATAETSDPGYIDTNYHNTVWWKYMPSSDGLLEIKMIAPTLTDLSNAAGQSVITIYRGTVMTSLTVLGLAYFDGIIDPDDTTDILYQICAAAISSGDTIYVEITDPVSWDTIPDRTVNWRFITTRVWEGPSTFPMPIYSGSNQLGIAMARFRGTEWPTPNDSRDNNWRTADWVGTGDGVVTLEPNGLLMDSLGVNVAINYEGTTAPDVFTGVTCTTDLEFQLGFIIHGFDGSAGSSGQFSTFDWRIFGLASTAYLGVVIEAQPNNTIAVVGWQVGHPSSYVTEWCQLALDWPIRTKWIYDATAEVWTVRFSYDGGTTWMYAASTPGTVPSTGITYGASEPGMFPGETECTYLFEGFSSEITVEPPDDPATLPGRFAYYHDGAWHLVNET